MLPILQNQSALSMTSREIAELTGKEHSNVKRDITNMILQLNYPDVQLKDCPVFHPSELKGHNLIIRPFFHAGNQYEEFILDREYCLLLVSGYSVALRKKIIDRWQELESKQSQPENPLLQLANAVLTAQSIIQDQTQKLLIAEPKAAALDLIAGSDDSRCIRDTAKELKIKPSRLTQYLLEKSWIYRQSREDDKLGKVMAYQHRIDQGLIEHCSVVIEQKGQTKLATSVKITGKGFAKLSLEFSGE